MTGSTDGRPYQVAGTVPAAGRPGLAYLGLVRSTVASSVLPGATPPGAGFRRSWPACLAAAVTGGRTTARAARPADGPPPEESSSPAETAAAATLIMPTVIAVRDA
jgi:hypothetical protein